MIPGFIRASLSPNTKIRNLKTRIDSQHQGETRETQGGFKNLQNRSRRRQSALFSSIIGVLAPTAVGGYDFLKPPWRNGHEPRPTCATRGKLLRYHEPL